jgi:hypothetical protein
MKVVSIVVNNPLFIEIQYHTLKKFIKCDYEFIIFSDAKDYPDMSNEGDITIKKQIEEMCEKLNIPCISIPNSHHKNIKGYSKRHADSLNFVLKYQLENPDQYLMIDSDMFLIDYFDIDQFKDYECGIVLQEGYHKKYIWPNLYFIDFKNVKNKELINFSTGHADTGGATHSWLCSYSNSLPSPKELRYADKNKTFHHNKIYFIRHLWSCTWNESEYPYNYYEDKLLDFLKRDPRNVEDKFYFEIYDNKFLHYRAGSGGFGEGLDFHKKLSRELYEILMNN